jgi:hypothetical protein
VYDIVRFYDENAEAHWRHRTEAALSTLLVSMFLALFK